MSPDSDLPPDEPPVAPTPAPSEHPRAAGMSAGPTAGAAAAPAAPPVLPVAEDRQRFVYAIGRIEARFPSLGIEKEYAQATGRAETVGLTDRQAVRTVLSDPANRYLARMMCWVLTVQGMDTYLLIPRDSTDLDLLLDSLRPAPSPSDTDVVIGALGPLAPPDRCNGLTVPMVAIDQIYSFDTGSFLESIPRPDSLSEESYRQSSRELLDYLRELADNTGTADEHRAVNYLTMRYPAIYAKAAEQLDRDSSLTCVDVSPARLSSVRTVMNVVFTYTNRSTNVPEKFAAKVDVTEEFPHLAAPLAPYYDR
ncbi:hypothetical protein AB0C51_04105 [Streptomyces pathocidini]|uniref:cyanobactin maturation protease PatG family protein n=1 Tax=Streptomyces pathocidini TaxID=1650571 RepID=UPI0033DB8D3B